MDSEPDVRSSGAGGRGETILVVHDQPDARDVIAGMLAEGGYRVLEASSGPEAIGHLRWSRQKISLVLTEAALPGMSGAALAGHIRRFESGTPILFCCGDSEVIDAAAAGPARVVKKPVEPATLLKTVRELLDVPPAP